MPPPKKRSVAAAACEALKQGQSKFFTHKKPQKSDRAEQADPSFVLEDLAASDSGDSEADSMIPRLDTVQPKQSETSGSKQKRDHDNADLVLDKVPKASRSTTAWRNATGVTKKARAALMQPGIGSFFKKKVVAPAEVPAAVPVLREPNLPTMIPDDQIIISDDESDNIIIDSVETLEPAPFIRAPEFPPVVNEPLDDQVSVIMDLEDDIILDSSPVVAPTLDDDKTASLAEPSESIGNSDESPSPDPPVDLEDIVGSPEQVHSHLKHAIQLNQKKLRSVLATDMTAAPAILDLEALKRFNDLRFAYSIAAQKQPDPSMDASAQVSDGCGKGPSFAHRLRKMAMHMLRTDEVLRTKQGKGAVHASLLNNPEVLAGLHKFTAGLIPLEEGGYGTKIKPEKLRNYINNHLFPALDMENTISLSTATRWLKRMGFKMCRVQKGVYVDGHERKDVVEAHAQGNSSVRLCYTYEGKEVTEMAPILKESEKIHYPIFHDETCVHANDQSNFVWMLEGEQPLRNKSRGCIVHVSDFIVEHCGRLSLTPEEIAEQMKLPVEPEQPVTTPNAPPPVISASLPTSSTPSVTPAAKKPAKKAAAKKSVPTDRTTAQSDWVKEAIKIFNVKYPDGVAVFIFDCSSAHEAFASDALLAHKMNRGPDGAQPKMHSTTIPGTQQTQSMVFPVNYPEKDSKGNSLASQPKGMEQVLHERGLLETLAGKGVGICSDCKKSQAARDKAIKEAKARQDEIEGSGVEGLAERFRELTDGTFPKAKELVPQCLDHVSTINIRRYFQHCYRYMDAYSKKLNYKQAAYAVKKYKSHRRIPATVMLDVNILSRG
ncbi:hypothetical protein C8J56DRAFT_883292 [Mycena floridula]|nr:hypothetical protein C8J56DRAFT_883292 [Mycena floridula]